MQEVTVKLAAPLRKYASNSSELQLRGATVGEVLGQLENTYPALATRVFKGPGELNHFVGVYLGKTNIRSVNGLDSSTRSGDVLTLIVAVAGG